MIAPGCIFDAERVYRYLLAREPSGDGPPVLFVMLNPSTADETQDDPTIRRCHGFARLLGGGQTVVANAFAYRATDPARLYDTPDPIGPRNDRWILETAREVASQGGRVVAAWGVHGRFRHRDDDLRRLLRPVCDLWALRLTKGGEPRHPLYLPAKLEPVLYSPRRAAA